MSWKEIKKYIPDSPKEISFLGSSIVRLSSAISAALVLGDEAELSLITIVMAWFGHEIKEYFKLHEKPEKDESVIK